MRRLAALAVVAVLMLPTVASGQDYSFGDWARDQGYSPGDVMPNYVRAEEAGIDSLNGIGEFDWTTTPTRELRLSDNQISSIESGAFSGLTDLAWLYMRDNTAMTELNLAENDFSSLERLWVSGNTNTVRVSLRNAIIESFIPLIWGGPVGPSGIFSLNGVTDMDLSGLDFSSTSYLDVLYSMDNMTDLGLVDTQNLDAVDLDVLLDNLETMEDADIEGILYMTQADFDAFNTAGGGLLAAWDAEPGHHVEFLQIGDVNHDTEVNGLDVDPFVDVLLASRFDVAADMNGDGLVNGLDVDPFVAAVVGGVQQVPEPSTLLLCIIALGVVGRRWK